MRTIKGPGLMLAQFLGPEPPFDRLDTLAAWTADMGYLAIQLPTFNPRIFDLERAASSRAYCDEIQGLLADHGLTIAELSTHRQGHVLASHPAYDAAFAAMAPAEVRDDRVKRQEWATSQLTQAAMAARHLGLDRHATFSGSLLWPFLYPYPPRPEGLVAEAFAELGRRWRPILDAFDDAGIDVAFEIHPGEDLHDGLTFEMFLDAVDQHPRANILYDPSHLYLQMIDYVGFIEVYAERIKCFHVKDAEFKRSPKTGLWGGYQGWKERAARFRSLGDGDIDFAEIFAAMTHIDYDGWAVVEWECCYKHPEEGAREGAEFVRRHIIPVADREFDATMQSAADRDRNRRLLGLGD